MTALRPLVASALLAICLVVPGSVGAFELTNVNEQPLRLDITATTTAAWNATARDPNVEYDQYGDVINRINLQFGWWKLSGGLRLDTMTFANPRSAQEMAGDRYPIREKELREQLKDSPEELEFELAELPETLNNQYTDGLRSRLRDDYRVGKLWLSYLSKNFEVTAGDSYVSFGRGLVLTMRKNDELASDTTLLGGKVIARSSLVNFTAVAGIANPLPLDEASGQTLLPLSGATTSNKPWGNLVYGQDALFGARGELTWKKAAFALQGVHLSRSETFDKGDGTLRGADGVQVFGTSVSVPVWDYGTAYVEGAYQQYAGSSQQGTDFDGNGYAIYSSVDGAWGPLTATVQLQHYRDFEALYASVDTARVPAFNTLAYSAPPNTETMLADYRGNYFDKCVTGGRSRVDGRVNDDLTVFGAYGHWATWGEHGECEVDEIDQRNDVNDFALGMELNFDEARSHFLSSAGFRYDSLAGDGTLYYREFHAEYTVSKHVTGPWSVELNGKHRTRFQWGENLVSLVPENWNEEEIYLGLKYSPKLILTGGFEYTGLAGKPATYFNGSVLWKYTTDSSVRVLAGQQRGSIKCISGVCREFPPFEGVKAEWIQRY